MGLASSCANTEEEAGLGPLFEVPLWASSMDFEDGSGMIAVEDGGGYLLKLVDGKEVARLSHPFISCKPIPLVEPGMHDLTFVLGSPFGESRVLEEFTLAVKLEPDKSYRVIQVANLPCVVEDGDR